MVSICFVAGGFLRDLGDPILRLAAAPAELLLDGCTGLAPAAHVLALGLGAGLFAEPLTQRVGADGFVVAVHGSARAGAVGLHVGRCALVIAAAERLPFSARSFDTIVANLALHEPARDRELLTELHRVARPGAEVAISVAMHGSFDEIFDALLEACEADAQLRARELLVAARHAQPTDEALTKMLARAGFELSHVGVQQRALLFDGGRAAIDDGMVASLLLPRWLGDERLSQATLARAGDALEAYLGPGRCAVRMRTAIVHARAQ